jgi:hypothetical protein
MVLAKIAAFAFGFFAFRLANRGVFPLKLEFSWRELWAGGVGDPARKMSIF